MVYLRCLEGGDVEHLASRQDHDVGQNNLVSVTTNINIYASWCFCESKTRNQTEINTFLAHKNVEVWVVVTGKVV